jgi:hypothetical protein
MLVWQLANVFHADWTWQNAWSEHAWSWNNVSNIVHLHRRRWPVDSKIQQKNVDAHAMPSLEIKWCSIWQYNVLPKYSFCIISQLVLLILPRPWAHVDRPMLTSQLHNIFMGHPVDSPEKVELMNIRTTFDGIRGKSPTLPERMSSLLVMVYCYR